MYRLGMPLMHRLGQIPLGRGGGAVHNLDFLLRDDFLTDEAAPITSPRTGEPGPGTSTFVQTDGTLAISSGKLVFTAQSTPVWGDQGRHDEAHARVAGLVHIEAINLSTWEECGIGWHTAAAVVDPDSMEHAIQAHATDGRLDNHNASQIQTGLSLSTDYKLAQVLRTTGVHQLLWVSMNWILLWVDAAGATATLYPVFASLDGAGNLDNNRVIDMPANGYTIWGDDYGIATDRLAGARSAGDTFTHAADCLIEFEATTVPAASSANLLFRKQDADNHWRVRVGAGGNLRLDEVVATVVTQRGSANGVIANGNRIMVIAEGTTIKVYVENALRITYSSANNFQTETAGEQDTLGLAGAVSDIVSWPRTLPADGYGLTRVAG